MPAIPTLTLPRGWTVTTALNKAGETVIVPVAPASLPTQIKATISTNGAALLKTDTLVALLAATPTGETLTLPPGHYAGTGNAPQAMTLTGARMTATTLDAAGQALASGKALICPMVTGMTIEAVSLINASCTDDNGAAIRGEGPGISFVANSVYISGCQNGVLTWGSPVLTGCTIENNGFGDGLTHEIYIDADAAGQVVTIENSAILCGMLSESAVKSRALSTVITASTLASGGNPNGNIAGPIVDVPDGGLFSATGCTLDLKPGSAVTLFGAYAMESGTNEAAGVVMAFRSCVFVDGTGTGGSIQCGPNITTATLDVTGSTYTGAVAPQTSGFAKVIGTISPAG